MAGLRLFLLVVVCAVWIQASTAEEVTCGDFGPYSSSGDFYNSIYRPFSSVPNCNITAKKQLFLRLKTLRNPDTTQVLDPYNTTSISSSNFDPKQKTIVLIHGWLDKYTRPTWKKIAAALLADGNHNVIHMDWSKANWFPYMQACSNLRLVGDYVAMFLNHVVTQYKVDPANIHIIGHSLGSHGSGYAGSTLRTKYNILVGRITGLDPAGPYFTNMPTVVRLDPTDAAEVDTMVTNGDVLFAMGSPQAMGQLNFYPNGGVDQPGCAKGILSLLPRTGSAIRSLTMPDGKTVPLDQNNPFDKITELFALDRPSLVDSNVARNLILDIIDKTGCSHVRALGLFLEGISTKSCMLKAFQCDSFDIFRTDPACQHCSDGHRCSPMGYRANITLAEKNRVLSFYTMTTDVEPYCAKLKVTFTLQNATSDSKEVKGKVYVTLYGTSGTTEKVTLTPSATTLTPGKKYNFLPEVSKDYGKLTAIGITWEDEDSIFSVKNMLSSKSIHLAGDVELTNPEGLVYVFRPAKPDIKSRTDVNARLIKTYDQ